jgi:hypothetical protein
METANPPASSIGLTMREPLERRVSVFCRFLVTFSRLYAAALAAGFVLILIILYSFTLCIYSFRAVLGPV